MPARIPCIGLGGWRAGLKLLNRFLISDFCLLISLVLLPNTGKSQELKVNSQQPEYYIGGFRLLPFDLNIKKE